MAPSKDISQTGNLFSLEGKSALITGATGYLGQEMALALAGAGAHIIVNSRNFARAKQFADVLCSLDYSAEPLAFDVTKESQVEEALHQIVGQPLHILINNAYSGGSGSLITADAEQYRKSFEVALVGAQYLLQATLPALRKGVEYAGDACVINIASMYGLVSPNIKLYNSVNEANPPFYGAAKAALIQWTRYAACQLGPQGIRVNSVSPGPFPSEGVKQSMPDFIDRLAQRVPLGRVGLANEIKGPIMFLASPAASYVNGTNLIVDGGWTAW